MEVGQSAPAVDAQWEEAGFANAALNASLKIFTHADNDGDDPETDDGGTMNEWVAVKELKLSYLNGYRYRN